MNKFTGKQEMCSQILSVVEEGEWRELYIRTYDTYFEVIEHSCGDMTWLLYGVPSRYQLITVFDRIFAEPVHLFFSEGDPTLGELASMLKACGISFGHLEVLEGKDVTYRTYHGTAGRKT